jgi:hypothetical protein
MAAWVVVVDTPYFAKTSADGTVTLKVSEHGDFHLSVWYPGPPLAPPVESQVSLTADETATEVKIDASSSPLPALRARAAPKAALQ